MAYNVRISPNSVRFFIFFLIILKEIRLEAKAQKIPLQSKSYDNYKDELFKEMAKVFKILQEHPLIENLPSTSTQFSHFSPSIGGEKRNIESSSQSQSTSSATKHPKMLFIPFQRNGKKKARSVDLKYKKTNMKNISPLLEINSNLVNVEFSTESYTESFQNKWFHKRFKFRRFNNHNGGNKKIWRQSLGHSYDPESNSERIPFNKPEKHEKKRKSRKLQLKNIKLDGNKEIFSAFNNVRENFKVAYTSGNSSQKHYDDFNERRNIVKYPRYSIELQAFKSDKADTFLNYFISSTENSAKIYDVKEEIHKKISKHTSSTTEPNFYFNKIIKTQKFAKSPKDYRTINFRSTSTETNDMSTESKRNFVESIDLQQVERLNHSMEGDSFINELLNYVQSHFILVVSILVISITLIIVLGIVTLCIGRKHDGSKKRANKFSPAGIQSFDLPARPNFNYDDIKSKANSWKSNSETTRGKDDGKSMFSIGSQSSMSDANSKRLMPFVRLNNTERWNREFSGLERSARNPTDPRNRNGFGSKPGERLLKLHRNFSSRSSMLHSSSSQQSTKSSPIQRREELENFSRNRAKKSSKCDGPAVQKAKCIKSVSPKTPTNPFEEVGEETVAKELQNIIENPECPPDMPPPVESKLTCVNRLLANRPSRFNVSPTNKYVADSIRPQNDAFKNNDKLSDDHRSNKLSLEEFSDDEPGIDY